MTDVVGGWLDAEASVFFVNGAGEVGVEEGRWVCCVLWRGGDHDAGMDVDEDAVGGVVVAHLGGAEGERGLGPL